MKKAKIMLLTIMVVATVGGALAFRAQRFAHVNVYCATRNAQHEIICSTSDFKTTACQLPHITTPCLTWHNAIGIGAPWTSSYYTTTQKIIDGVIVTCPNPLRACTTLTDIQ